MKAKVTVRLKSGVLDPQGKAILHAAQSLDLAKIRDVRVGKVFELDLEDASPRAVEMVKVLAEKLLANTVIENFEVEMLD
jgi:phosphoribosylformylglycinamidine synthase